METEAEKRLSKPVSHRKIAIGVWMLVMAILLIDLFLVTWSHIYRPDLYKFVLSYTPYLVIIAFFLLLLSFALNRWKPIFRK
ncbi:MAG: hypothetical protein ABSA75_11640 [Candidatus Bathyarchaeia archaeon]|jgi:uncharacterized membrane protein YbhN (UPF0104 family)